MLSRLLSALLLFALTPMSAPAAVDPDFNPRFYTYGQVPEMSWNPVSEWLYCRVVAERIDGVDLTTNLIRLDEDGVWDDTWALDHDGDITCIALLDDGKMLIGGDFTEVDGHTTYRVARLNVDGSVDTTFTATSSDLPAPDGEAFIDALAADDSGNVYVGFYEENGSFTGDYLFCLGPASATFNVTVSGVIAGPFTYEYFGIKAIYVDGDSLIIGGSFTTINGANQAGLAKVSLTGLVDSNFNISLWPVTSSPRFPELVVNDIDEASDGNLWVGGAFNVGQRHGLIRISKSGQLLSPTAIEDPINRYSNGVFRDIKADGVNVVAVGYLYGINWGSRTIISDRINTSGNFITDYNSGAESSSIALVGGKSLIGCGNPYYNGVPPSGQRAITYWDSGGSELENIDIKLYSPTIPSECLIRTGNRPLYYGENIFGFNESYVHKLVALNEDGSIDTSFNTSFVANSISAWEELPDERILCVGSFSREDWSSSRGVLLLEADGTIAQPFENLASRAGPDWYDVSILLLPSGKIYVGDIISLDNASNSSRLILNYDEYEEIAAAMPPVEEVDLATFSYAWDTGLFTRYIPGTGVAMSGKVCVQPNGKLVAIKSDSKTVQRVNIDGILDANFSPPDNFYNPIISDIFTDGAGRIYLFGSFKFTPEASPTRLIRLQPDGALDDSFMCSIGVAVTRGMSLDNEGNFYISGYITSSSLTANIARIKSDGFIDENFYFTDDQSWYIEALAPNYVYANDKRYTFDDPIPPEVFITPNIAERTEGDDITFWLADRGAEETYQWLSNGAALAGQAGPSLTLDPTTLANAGVIGVQATGPGGTVMRTATLNVAGYAFAQWGAQQGYTEPELAHPDADLNGDGLSLNDEFLLRTDLFGPATRTWASPVWNNGAMTINFTMLPGRRYWIDCSTNLVNWTPIDSYTSDAAEPVAIEVDFDPETPCFYQVRVELIEG